MAHQIRRGKRRGKTAARAAFLAALLPGALLPAAAFAQSLSSDGQTLPAYDAPDPFLQLPRGPALAPTEDPDATARYADGTEAAHITDVASGRSSVRITDSGTPGKGSPATLLADQVTLDADNRLTASGGVVIWHQGARLVASRVIYDNETGGAVIGFGQASDMSEFKPSPRVTAIVNNWGPY